MNKTASYLYLLQRWLGLSKIRTVQPLVPPPASARLLPAIRTDYSGFFCSWGGGVNTVFVFLAGLFTWSLRGRLWPPLCRRPRQEGSGSPGPGPVAGNGFLRTGCVCGGVCVCVCAFGGLSNFGGYLTQCKALAFSKASSFHRRAAALQSKPPSAALQGAGAAPGRCWALGTLSSTTSALTTALSYAGGKTKTLNVKNRPKALLEVTVTTKPKALFSLSGRKPSTFVTRTLVALLTYSINVSPSCAKAVAQLSFSDNYSNDFNLYVARHSPRAGAGGGGV